MHVWSDYFAAFKHIIGVGHDDSGDRWQPSNIEIPQQHRRSSRYLGIISRERERDGCYNDYHTRSSCVFHCAMSANYSAADTCTTYQTQCGHAYQASCFLIPVLFIRCNITEWHSVDLSSGRDCAWMDQRSMCGEAPTCDHNHLPEVKSDLFLQTHRCT